MGILIVSPEETHTPISTKLNFNVTNNGAKYETCILRHEVEVAMEIQKLKVYGDSSLIINQISGKWKVRSETLASYESHFEQLSSNILEIQYTYLPR